MGPWLPRKSRLDPPGLQLALALRTALLQEDPPPNASGHWCLLERVQILLCPDCVALDKAPREPQFPYLPSQDR